MSPKVGFEALHTGSGYVCLDATQLIAFNNTGHLDLLESWFGPTAYTPLVVIEEELSQRPKQNAAMRNAPWLYWVAPHDDDTEFVAKLHRRFMSEKDKNRGEADLIAACCRHGWTALLDDEDGRSAATDFHVPHVYMATLLAVVAAYGMLRPAQAWKLHAEIEKARGYYSPLKTDEASHDVFMSFWQMMCKLRKLLLSQIVKR